MERLVINDLENYGNYLVEWIKKEVKKANAKGVVFGLSGGIDSAVVSLLAKKAFPQDHLALIMPYTKHNLDYQLANKLAVEHSLNFTEVNFSKSFNKLFNKLPMDDKLIKGNMMAIFRMSILYAYAQQNHYLVLGTDNACEWHIGYFTKFGDGGADLFPLIKLLKREVKSLGKILAVPKEIILRAPSASLWENQSDEIEMQFTYDELDDYLSNRKVNDITKTRIETLHRQSAHKRVKGPMPKNVNEYLQ